MPGPVALLWEMSREMRPGAEPTHRLTPFCLGLELLFSSKAVPVPEWAVVMGHGKKVLLSRRGAWWALAREVTLCFLFQLKTTTTAVISKDFTEDQIWLNGQKVDVGQPRIQACLRESECVSIACGM